MKLHSSMPFVQPKVQFGQTQNLNTLPTPPAKDVVSFNKPKFGDCCDDIGDSLQADRWCD
jgi:hypothetical protein